MIILINGTYGVGKSSVSKEIQRQIENGKVRLFDPDVILSRLVRL